LRALQRLFEEFGACILLSSAFIGILAHVCFQYKC